MKVWAEKFGRKLLSFLSNWSKSTALLCGILLSTALPPYYQLWAAFLSFSTVMYLCAAENKLSRLAGIGYWFGFGYFACGFYWIGNALLVDAGKTGWLYPLVLLLNGAAFGVFTILPFMLSKFGKNTVLKIVIVASSWGLCTEWLRGVLFTGFPWNPLSSIMAFRPALLQTLALWGTYGLSMLVVVMASWGAVWLVKPQKKTFLAVFLAPVMLMVLWGYGEGIILSKRQVEDGDSIMVRLVQPSIPQSLKWEADAAEQNLKEYIELSQAKDSDFVDFVIWGETATPFDIVEDIKHNALISSAAPRYGYLITGFLRYEPFGDRYRPFNSFAVINRRGEIKGLYDKSHLVPFGEYIPFREYMPSWVRPLTNTVSEFGRGQKYQTIKLADFPEFAPLICYEVIFSDEIVRKTNKPKWAIVLTNDGWYGISSGPYQHLVAAQMRAVEEGISIVRSANSGISAVINPYGQITARIPLGVRGKADALVKPDESHVTLFGYVGNIIPLFMGFIGLFAALFISGLFKRKA